MMLDVYFLYSTVYTLLQKFSRKFILDYPKLFALSSYVE